MNKLTLSIMHISPEALDTLNRLLDQFRSEHRIEVDLLELDWSSARDTFSRVAVYQQGPDISEIGSTWLPDYASMNSLLPIFPKDLPDTINRNNYNASAWQSAHLYGDNTLWSIPWLEDTMIIFYRADILKEAGVNIEEAFSTVDALDEAAARLSNFGVSIPFLIPTAYNKFVALHTLASWVWTAGGAFTSEDGSQMYFADAKALAGMRKYLHLLHYISPEGRELLLKPVAVEELLRRDKVAMTFGTLRWPDNSFPAADREKWRPAVSPGIPFAGGSHLVVWRHTRNLAAAIRLLQFLTRPEIIADYAFGAAKALPAHKEAQALVKDDNPAWKVMMDSASKGRTYGPVRLWGIIETRLLNMLPVVVNAYLENPEIHIDQLLEEHVVDLAKRLNLTFSS